MTDHRKRILFVDDDPMILASLKAAMRRDRQRWDIVFALGSQEALAALEVAAFDAIVSDMRMPGIDGAELLARVKLRSPTTRRIVLSGSVDGTDAARAAAAAEHVLTKPCSVQDVRAALERLLAAYDESRARCDHAAADHRAIP